MLSTEFHASLTAIVAVAFAMEALALELESNGHKLREGGLTIPKKPTKGFYVGHRLVQAFQLVGEFADSLPGDLDELFGLRNDGVHFESEYRDGVHQHPSGYQTAYELTIYTLERSIRALGLARSVIAACTASAANKACDDAAKYLVPELPGVLGMLDIVLESEGIVVS